MADLPERISGALHLLGVGVDGEVALGQVVELLLEDDGAGLLVRLEQRLDGDVQCAGILIGLHGEVEDRVFNGAVHPAANAGVGLRPRGVSRARGRRAVDVAEQSVLAAEGGEEGLPLGVVGTLKAEVDRDVLLHVDGGISREEGWSNAVPKGAGGSGAQDAGRGRGSRGGRHGTVNRTGGGGFLAGAARLPGGEAAWLPGGGGARPRWRRGARPKAVRVPGGGASKSRGSAVGRGADVAGGREGRCCYGTAAGRESGGQAVRWRATRGEGARAEEKRAEGRDR